MSEISVTIQNTVYEALVSGGASFNANVVTNSEHSVVSNDVLPSDWASTGFVDRYYYPRSNPSGYGTGSAPSIDTGNFYPRTNPSGYITGVISGADSFQPVRINMSSAPTRKRRESNVALYAAQLSGVNFSNSNPYDTYMTYFEVDGYVPRQKARLYVNGGDSKANNYSILPVSGTNENLNLLRTTSFLGGRFREYTLTIGMDLYLSFRHHQPINNVVMNVMGSVNTGARVILQNLTKNCNNGHQLEVKVNFNSVGPNTPINFVDQLGNLLVSALGNGTQVQRHKFVYKYAGNPDGGNWKYF